MRLEANALKGDADKISIKPEINDSNGYYSLITANTLYKLMENNNGYKNEDITAFGQKYLINGMVEIANRVLEDASTKNVALSGGVMVNGYITHIAITILKKLGLEVFLQKSMPPGDGGIALGQCCAALSSVI